MKVTPVNMAALIPAVIAITGEENAVLIEKLYTMLDNAMGEGFEAGYRMRQEEESTDEDAIDAAWDDGFDNGYSRGYKEAEFDPLPEVAPTDEELFEDHFDDDDVEDATDYVNRLYANCDALDRELNRVETATFDTYSRPRPDTTAHYFGN